MTAPDIFQVEDNADFTFLMEYAVDEISKDLKLDVFTNGNEALTALCSLQAKAIRPGLILLDINLPGISGFEVLKRIRDNDFFQSVPVVIFSTSDNPKDMNTMMEAGANDYQVKPMGYRDLVNCLKKMKENYLHID